MLLHGAVPFIASPTLGQAVWTTGFGLSFAESFPPAIFATDFGAPEPAAIAFGLSGAYTAGLFIAAGLHPSDAYAAMNAFWLALAFVGAWRLSTLLGLAPTPSLLAALVWISQPVIWAHSGYSMLSLGFALLPAYLLVAFALMRGPSGSCVRSGAIAVAYFLACVIAAFMDGYSFMMFAVSASILWLSTFSAGRKNWQYHIFFAGPVHTFALVCAYVLYTAYVGRSGFEPNGLDFFRGWGADVSFFVQPSAGQLWIWDQLGLSVARTHQQFFGDASVWQTTFIVPLALTGIAGLLFARTRPWFAAAMSICVLVGLYMSLGPSLKFWSMKPEEVSGLGGLMPAEYAGVATGSGWFSENIPGLNNMRASYRWVALGVLGLWGLTVMLMLHLQRRHRIGILLIVATALVISNLPSPLDRWQYYKNNRAMFMQIDADMVADMKAGLVPNELVAFVPWYNDFLANYIAPASGIRTYNIGGDKNLSVARLHWPPTMSQFPMARIDPAFANRSVLLLARAEADVIVVPFVDMLRGAHKWPLPAPFADDIEQVLDDLRSIDFVSVEARRLYAVVRLAPAYRADVGTPALERMINDALCIQPLCLAGERFNPFVPHQIGQVEDGALVSDGRQGFLHFGPYASFERGGYRLTVEGRVDVPAGAWVDVVSDRGQRQHARFELSDGEGGVPLLREQVTLEEDVPDLEIRVWVSSDTVMRLSAYELRKLDGPTANGG